MPKLHSAHVEKIIAGNTMLNLYSMRTSADVEMIRDLQQVIEKNKITTLTMLASIESDIDDTAAEILSKIKTIEILKLNDNLIGDEGAKNIATLPNLFYLDISCNDVGDEGFKALIKNPNLMTLDISHTKVTVNAVKEALVDIKAHPKLTALFLRGIDGLDSVRDELDKHFEAKKKSENLLWGLSAQATPTTVPASEEEEKTGKKLCI